MWFGWEVLAHLSRQETGMAAVRVPFLAKSGTQNGSFPKSGSQKDLRSIFGQIWNAKGFVSYIWVTKFNEGRGPVLSGKRLRESRDGRGDPGRRRSFAAVGRRVVHRAGPGKRFV